MPDKINVEIGKRLRMLRHAVAQPPKKKLTTSEMGELLGMSQSYYSYMETGSRTISIEVIVELVKRFKLSPTWLITGVGDMYMGKENKSIMTDLNNMKVEQRVHNDIINTLLKKL